MWTISNSKFNPNPITKFFVVGLLGLTVLHPINYYLEWLVVGVFSVMYLLNGFKRQAFKNIIVFGGLFLAPSFTVVAKLPIMIKMIFSLLFVIRMFYIPFAAGKFLIDRKSTRLNSSHANISYAVFCLKKKSHRTRTGTTTTAPASP